MPYSNRRATLLPTRTVAGATSREAGTVFSGLVGCDFVGAVAKFAYGAGGTTCKVWLQSSLDDGATWFDIASFAFTTAAASKMQVVRCNTPSAFTPATAPSDGTLADDTVISGLIGDRFRTLLTTTGTYTGATSITVDAIFKGRPA